MGRSAGTARDGDLVAAPSSGDGMRGKGEGGGGDETEENRNQSLAGLTGRPTSAGRGFFRRGAQPTAKTKTVGVGTSPRSLSPTAASQKKGEPATAAVAVSMTAAAATAAAVAGDGGRRGSILKSVGVGTSPRTSPKTSKREKSPTSISHGSPNAGAAGGKSSGIVTASRSPVSGGTKGDDLNTTITAVNAEAEAGIVCKDDETTLSVRREANSCRETGEKNRMPAVNDLDATLVDFPAGIVGGKEAEEGATSGEPTTHDLGATLVTNFSPGKLSSHSSSTAPEGSLRPIVEKESRLKGGQVMPPDGNGSPCCADDGGFHRNRGSHQQLRNTKKTRVAPLDAGGNPASKGWEGSSTCQGGNADGGNASRSSGGSVVSTKRGRGNVVGPTKTPPGAGAQCARPAEISQDLVRGRAGGKCGCSVM